MKATVLAGLTVLLFFTGPAYAFPTYQLDSSERFTPDAIGEIREEKFRFLGGTGKYQSGVIRGIEFWISMDDYRALLGKWNVRCVKDAITDRKYCRANFRDLDIDLHDNGRNQVSIGSENFPGSNVTIRIDKGQPISNEPHYKGNPWFSTGTSKAIVAKLKSAKTVTTRYKKFPYESYVDDTWEVEGFAAVQQYLQWAVKRVK